MTEKKSQTQEQAKETEKPNPVKMSDKKAATSPVPVSLPPVSPTPVVKLNSSNDLYRKLLPAVLFLLTFVTVMTMLLVYMDNVALGAQKFRVNMSRAQELSRIPQDSPALALFVKQVHLQAPARAPLQPVPTRPLASIDKVFGSKYTGSFVEILPQGARDQTTLYLETTRGWRGLVVRAAPRDHLTLRGLHACLSHSDHPREVSYPLAEAEGDEGISSFSSRVLCLPLYTILSVSGGRTDLLLLAATDVPALTHLPRDFDPVQMIEVRSTDLSARNESINFLTSRNYTVAAEFDDTLVFNLNYMVNKV